MPSLEVPNAALYYETFGSGPLLLLIPGADGRGAVFHPVAIPRREIHCHFENRLNTDADDAHLLITHLSPTEPATVFGTSSGAIVSQNLLIRHPQSAKLVIAHEPPSLAVLPDKFRIGATALIQHVYDTYRVQGVAAAMEVFSAGLSEGDDGAMMRHCIDTKRGDEIRANSMYWFEFELRQYTCSPLDLDVILALKEKYVLAAGLASGDGPGVGPISVIAGFLGKEVVRLPGGHIAYMTEPEVFADGLLKVLENIY